MRINSPDHSHGVDIVTDPDSGNITISKENWKTVGQTIGFKAPDNTEPGNPQIYLRMISDDPNFQYPKLAEKSVTANIVEKQAVANATGSMTGIPLEKSVGENREFTYTVMIDENPTQAVTIDITNTTNLNGFNCIVTPLVSYPFSWY